MFKKIYMIPKAFTSDVPTKGSIAQNHSGENINIQIIKAVETKNIIQ
jgi:hypothetical protein